LFQSSIAAIPGRDRLRLPGTMFLRVLVERRNLIGQLVRRDFEARFVGSVAGWLWTLIQPLVLLLSWVFVFMFCMRVPPPPEAAHKSYVVFLFCGYLPWMLLSETLQRSANCIVDNSTLITKTVFPSEVLPVTLFLSSLISNALATTLAVAGVLITEHRLPGTIVVLPVFILIVALLATGVSWIASSLQVYLRDTSQFVSVLLTAWFWTTPIFMYESMMRNRLPGWAWTGVRLNPLTAIVGGYRRALLLGQWPNWNDLALSAAISAGVFVLGGLFFRRLKRGFADVL
jgi:ABC-type polysaccharide/polyol phosphate export permease